MSYIFVLELKHTIDPVHDVNITNFSDHTYNYFFKF